MSSKAKPLMFSGKTIDVLWDSRLCIHVSECGQAAGDLFVGGRKPWCQPDLSDTDEAKQIVERCPSGALAYRDKAGGPAEAGPAENTVFVACNGPLFVHGDLHIDGVDPTAQPGLQFRAALCRCGASKNKPFCDNSHEEIDFKDYGAVGERGEGAAGSGGALQITPLKDGSLLCKGNLSVHAATGRLAWQGTTVALCRCGASKNKPFCDGSHKNIGFKSD